MLDAARRRRLMRDIFYCLCQHAQKVYIYTHTHTQYKRPTAYLRIAARSVKRDLIHQFQNRPNIGKRHTELACLRAMHSRYIKTCYNIYTYIHIYIERGLFPILGLF